MEVVLEQLPGNATEKANLKTKSLKRQRVYILPTLQGWLYALMLIIMLLGAINYNNSIAFLFCFLLSSLGIIAMLHTYRNLTGLIISATKPQNVFAGQQAMFPIRIDNRLGIERFSIQLQQKEKRYRSRFKKKIKTEKMSISIATGKLLTVHYPIMTKQRGIVKSGRLILSTRFPLGLFNAWSSFEPDETCLAYPAPKGRKQLPLTNLSTTLNDKTLDCSDKLDAYDFAGFTKYRPGDRINIIAWKAYAREQGLLIKQFSGKGSQALLFNWNSIADISSIESRLSQLCYWILIAEGLNIEYGLDIPGFIIRPKQGNQHKKVCLEALARYGLPNG